MASQDEILLAAVIKQVAVTNIDYRVLAKDIGATTAGAAAKRWQRYRTKLKSTTDIERNGKGSPSKPAGVQKNGNGTKGKKAGKTNVRNVKEGLGDDGGKSDGGVGERDGEPVAMSTPTRKLPGRTSKSKVKSLKIESEEEDEGEESVIEDDEPEDEELDFDSMDNNMDDEEL